MRYAFVNLGSGLHAIPASLPQDQFVGFGGILLQTREPRTPDEWLAVRQAESAHKAAADPRRQIRRLGENDIEAIMARKIAERAREAGQVERRDFHQAGIPDEMIDAHLERAVARARRIEPKLDAMVSA